MTHAWGPGSMQRWREVDSGSAQRTAADGEWRAAARRTGMAARLDRGSCPSARPPWVQGGLELGFVRGKKREGIMGWLQLSAQTARKKRNLF
jgi:hypothetical protein